MSLRWFAVGCVLIGFPAWIIIPTRPRSCRSADPLQNIGIVHLRAREKNPIQAIWESAVSGRLATSVLDRNELYFHGNIHFVGVGIMHFTQAGSYFAITLFRLGFGLSGLKHDNRLPILTSFSLQQSHISHSSWSLTLKIQSKVGGGPLSSWMGQWAALKGSPLEIFDTISPETECNLH